MSICINYCDIGSQFYIIANSYFFMTPYYRAAHTTIIPDADNCIFSPIDASIFIGAQGIDVPTGGTIEIISNFQDSGIEKFNTKFALDNASLAMLNAIKMKANMIVTGT